MFKVLLIISAVVALSCAAPSLIERIVGGVEVDIDDYPYQISLQNWGSHSCGGSIIGKKWIVTAAHCTDGSSASNLKIRAGSSEHRSGGVVIAVEKIHQNPQYDSSTIDYDITLLELESELIYGDKIQPISLPSLNEETPAGSDAYCTGWGTLSEEGSLPNHLRGVDLKVIDQDECNDAYDGQITDRMLCAGVDGGGKDHCYGDSGGPVVVDGKLVGIVSWAYGCARPNYPGVNGRVASLRDYITDVSGI